MFPAYMWALFTGGLHQLRDAACARRKVSELKLWLDDIRPAPEGFTLARTAPQAIALLSSGQVTFASLDHDVLWEPMAEGEPVPDDWQSTKTGYAVVLWMERNDVWPRDGVKVHSANKAGAARMQAVIDAHYRADLAAGPRCAVAFPGPSDGPFWESNYDPDHGYHFSAGPTIPIDRDPQSQFDHKTAETCREHGMFQFTEKQ